MLPTPSIDAMMPPISTLTCATDEPNIAGSMSFTARLTPACRGFHLGFGNALMRARNGNWNSSWQTPATNTAYASAMPGCSRRGDSHTAAAINTTFRMTGVNAGTAKRP